MILIRTRHCIYLCMLLLPTAASAGNSRSFFLGDEAAMTAGAGIAVSADSGSLWYNPAGLGGLNLGRMELTGTVYSAKLRSADGILKTNLPSGSYSTNTRADDFGSVPTSLVFVRHGNDKISYGLAWYQTEDMWLDFRSDMTAPFDASGRTWFEGFEYHQRGYVYHIGPSVGAQLHRRFRIGASLYFVYRNLNANLRAFVGLDDGDEEKPADEMSALSMQASAMDLGLMLTIGAQWEPVDHWHIGLVLRTPTFRVWYSGDGSALESDIIMGDDGNLASNFSYVTESEGGMTFEQVVPMEAQLGVVYRRGRNWIGIEGAVRPPLDDMNQTFLWNVSAGGRLALSSVLSWGAGLFTDNSSNGPSQNILAWRSDRYGLTTGLEFKTPLVVKGRKREKTADASKQPQEAVEKERTLTWATTVAVSYSFELAEYQAMAVDVDTDFTLKIQSQKSIFHQGFIYLGTALYF